jgi:hypothetical protein
LFVNWNNGELRKYMISHDENGFGNLVLPPTKTPAPPQSISFI